ncbi:uncharacterized protein LOC115755305 [Rhodamnia argentea]|uniref:Small ribosomal subunit protein bS18c n=1 Tax=Rhodamnia argentea TaxID=178133 RepID=A0ABM3HU69_9MYRT|nr:uncharacterized protein LOC115755305 [Rhodamnia argentea]
MTLSRAVMRSLNNGLVRQFHRPHLARPLSVNAASGHNSDDKQRSNSSESAEEFERRIFGGFSGNDSKTDSFFQKFDRIDRARVGSRLNGHNSDDKRRSADEFEGRIFGGFSGNDSKTDSFFQKFDRIDRARSGSRLNGEDSSRMFGHNSDDKQRSADEFEGRIFGGFSGNDSKTDSFFQKFDRIDRARSGSRLNGEDSSWMFDGLKDNFSTLSDGMDVRLKEEALYFDYDLDETEADGYSFRPDVNFPPGTTYDIKDLDLKKPGVRKFAKRRQFEVTTEEVLRKADFRNVRFLANFITEAGIIIKRSSTRIRAKAQRKVAREIKTARAFGLMPFTTMGTKSFVFGKTMENLDVDYEYEAFEGMGGDMNE